MRNQSPSLPWSSPRSPGGGAHLETRLLRAVTGRWASQRSPARLAAWLRAETPRWSPLGMQRPRRASAEDNVNTMPAATARVSPQGTRVHAHVSEGSVKSLRAAVSSRLTVPGARALSNVCRQESRSERGGGRVGVRVLTLPGPWPEALHVWFQPSSRPGLPGAQPPEGNACHISSCLVLSALIFSIWGH